MIIKELLKKLHEMEESVGDDAEVSFYQQGACVHPITCVDVDNDGHVFITDQR